MLKKTAIIFLTLLLMLFLVLALVSELIQSRFFKDFLADKAADIINKNINGELSIGRIDGNFFTHVEIHNALLTIDNDTTAFIPLVSLHYQPNKLLQKQIILSSVRIDSPFVAIRQYADSTWVFDRIVKSRPDSVLPPTDRPSEKKSALAWTINLQDFNLANLQADMDVLDKRVPQKISNLNVLLAAFVSDRQKWVELKQLRFQTEAPSLKLSNLSFTIEQNSDGIQLQDFIFQTGRNMVTANAQLDSTTDISGRIEAQTAPIDVSELQFILPDISIKGVPQLELAGKILNDKLDAAINIRSTKSSLALNATIDPFSSVLNDSVPSVRYNLESSFKNIVLSDWGLENDIQLNGDIRMAGEGFTPQSARAEAVLALRNCTIDRYFIPFADISADYASGDAAARMDIKSDMGNVQAQASIKDLFGAQHFQTSLACQRLNLEPILSDSAWTCDLNFDVKAAGQHFSLENMQADVEFAGSHSSLLGMSIDTSTVVLALEKSRANIKKASITSPAIFLDASGSIHPSEASLINLYARTADMNHWRRFIPSDSLGGAAALTAQIQGTLDSVLVESTVNIDSIRYNNFSADSVRTALNGQWQDSTFSGAALAHINNLDLGALTVQAIDLDAYITPERIDLKSRVRQSDTISAETHLQYFLYELPMVFIKQLDLNVSGREWRGGSDSTSVMLGDREYIVTNFMVRTQSTDSTSAYVYADGAVSLDGEEDLTIKVQNYNLGVVMELFEKPVNFGGLANLDLRLTGTAESPQLVLNTNLHNLFYEAFHIESLIGQVRYENKELNSRFALVPLADTLAINSSIPMIFSLADPQMTILRDQPFHLNITSNDIPIAPLVPENLGLDRLAGMLKLDIEFGNTIANIEPTGTISITDGGVRHKDLGFRFDDLDALIKMKKDSVIIEQLVGRNGKGSINARGFAVMDSRSFPGAVNGINLSLKAQDFYLSRKPEHLIQIASDIKLSGAADSLVYEGRLDVLRSSFYLPALSASNKNSAQVREQPLLIQALEKAQSTQLDSTIELKHQQQAPPLLKNMRGKLALQFPNNTWIKSDNMRLELSGDLDIVKNSEDFEIFGPIQILRGQYDFLGRRFKLAESSAMFQGGNIANPRLDVKGEYVFRDVERNKRKIILQVTGEAESPDIQFRLDEEPINEGEAVSYILFNRSQAELSQQTSNGSSSGSFVASDLVYGLMSAELSKFASRKIGVDYIEFKGTSSTNNVAFMVGKYITPDLFMSYEHYIGALEEDQAPRVVTVEYELTKYIFLQIISGDTKTTGADVMIKFTSE